MLVFSSVWKNIPRPRSSQKLRLVVSVSNVSLVEVTVTKPSFFSCHLNMEHGHPDCSCKFIKQYSVKHANWCNLRVPPPFPVFLPEVLMMDLDILVRGNLDELFQLRAMSFTFAWATIMTLADITLDWFSKANLQHIVWTLWTFGSGLVNSCSLPRNCGGKWCMGIVPSWAAVTWMVGKCHGNLNLKGLNLQRHPQEIKWVADVHVFKRRSCACQVNWYGCHYFKNMLL